jgi:hypothetical protein
VLAAANLASSVESVTAIGTRQWAGTSRGSTLANARGEERFMECAEHPRRQAPQLLSAESLLPFAIRHLGHDDLGCQCVRPKTA